MAIVTLDPTRGAMRTPSPFGLQIKIGALTTPVMLSGEAVGGNPENYRVPARRNLAIFFRNDGDDPTVVRIPGLRRNDGVFLRERVFTVPADGKIYGCMVDPGYAGNSLRVASGVTNLLPGAVSGVDITAREMLLTNGDWEDATDSVPDGWTITQPNPTGGANQGAITFVEGDTNRFTFVQPATPTAEGFVEAEASPWSGLDAEGIVVEVARFFFTPGASGKGIMRVAWTETPGDVEFTFGVNQSNGGDFHQDGASVSFSTVTVSQLIGAAGTFGAEDFFRLGCPSAFYPEEITTVQVWRETEITNYAKRWTLDTAARLTKDNELWAWFRLTLVVGLSPDPFMEGEVYRVRVEFRDADTNVIYQVARDHRYQPSNSLQTISIDFSNGAISGSIPGRLRVVVDIQKEPASGTAPGMSLSATLVRLDEMQTAGPGFVLFECPSEDCQIAVLDLDTNPGAFTPEFSK